MKSKFLQTAHAVEFLIYNSRLSGFSLRSHFRLPPPRGLVWDSDVPQKNIKKHSSPGRDSNPLVPQSLEHISNLLLSTFSCLNSKVAGPQGEICGFTEKNNPCLTSSFSQTLQAKARGTKCRFPCTFTETGKHTRVLSNCSDEIQNGKAPGTETLPLLISNT